MTIPPKQEGPGDQHANRSHSHETATSATHCFHTMALKRRARHLSAYAGLVEMPGWQG
jgi:hypothetical protein